MGNGKRPTEWLTVHEVKKLLQGPDLRSNQGLRDRCVLQILAEGGIRRGELIALKVGSFTTHNGLPVLTVPTLKKRKDKTPFRTVHITGGLAQLLTRYIGKEHGPKPDPERALFMTSATRGSYDKGPITARAVDLIFQRHLRQAGINKRITSHSLRHTCATRLLETGADVETVRQILGHSSLSSTQRYVHSTMDRQREAIERLGFDDGK